jgi:RAT1-interacting protein
LSEGYDQFVKQDDSKDEHLDGLLKALMHHERKTERRLQADIITWRGMMTKLMTAPFDRFDGFEMKATVFQGTIFIEEDHDAKLRRNSKNTRGPGPGNIPNDMFQYWGYKFESLCLIPDTWDATSRAFIEGRERNVVSNKAQYCSIVKTGMGPYSMIMGGEVDAGMLNSCHLVLKTHNPVLTRISSMGSEARGSDRSDQLLGAQDLANTRD